MKQTDDLGKRAADDGVRTSANPQGRLRTTLLVVAAAAVLLPSIWFLHREYRRAVALAPTPGAGVILHKPAPRAPQAEVAPANVVRRTVRAVRVQTGDAEAKSRRRPGKRGIDAGEYIEALRDAGVTGGITDFPPPGTRPPSSGVIVPEGYPLPEGFVRHYQSTDRGKQLDPVLTVAPGYELIDEGGEKIVLGLDRIVPPEYAPADMPIEMLEVPSDRKRGGG